ncbi:unnamed protein product [Rhizophagus irregularis]|nr:unnamed protein product [Rhizophagus irregularis]
MPPIRPEKTKGTRTAINVNVKKEVCEYMKANPNINQGNVASFFNEKYQEFNIDRTTISKIWKDREKWLAVLPTSQTSHIFRNRSVQFPELDKAMQIWTAQAAAAGLPLSDSILQLKGIEFAKMLSIEDQLKCTNGWVYRFKLRNGLQKVNFSGEANSAPLETLPEERLRLRTLLAKYDEKDIYNADETGLFFRMEPNQTLSTGKISGRKKDKNRLSVLLCSNSDGSHKFSPLVIGKSLNPRCFKNINKSNLPVIYRANSKAWMRSDIFIEWLHYLDNWFRTMDRKILLLIDNAGSYFNSKIFDENNSDLSEDDPNTEGEVVAESSHSAQNRKKSKKKAIKKRPDIKLTNIELAYLPPNTTAHLQPMDVGIIHSFKSKYKWEFCMHLIRQFDSGIDREKNKLNVKEAIDYIAEAWNSVSSTTIRNCWIKTGILPSSDYVFDDVDNLQNFEIDGLNDSDDEFDIDCLPEADHLREFFQMFDHEIPTEEHFTDEQIINLLQDEINGDSEDDISDEEIQMISDKEGINALKTFINYFEQQHDTEFNVNDLYIFRKYLRIVKYKEAKSKKQSTLDLYFN